MERTEKGVEREGKGKKQQELEGRTRKKFKRGIILGGKRGGPSTPSPTWRLEFSSLDGNNGSNPVQEYLNTTTTVSARKLCANLWEIQPELQLSLSKMSKNIGSRRGRRGHHKTNKAFELRTHLVDPPNNLLDQPAIASPSRRHVAQSLLQHHVSADRNSRAIRSLSSASCASSMEVAPYKPLGMQSSSFLDFKCRMDESSYSLKTSTKLLTVINRIWSLEEQQACNLSLLKSLKMELDHSRSQIKELLKEKQTNRQEIDDLMEQVTEDKVVRKNKEHYRIKAVIKSAQEELEDERKLRKHSESLHRKLAREFSEVKSAFSNALKELERERKARILLENLCDEFAKGIRDYEQEVQSLRHKSEMDLVGTDCLVLHISEAWLDERMEMKLAEAENDLTEKNTIVDKLSLDIETFLQARHSNESKKNGRFVNEAINNCSRRESFPLNEAVSAPRHDADEEDSIDSDSPCFELDKSTGKKQNTGSSKCRGNNCAESLLEEIMNLDSMKRMAGSRDNSKGRIVYAQLNSNDVLDNLIRNRSLSSEGDKIHPEEFDKSDSSLKLPMGVKENTLKAKLLEARLESQKSRSKVSKVFS
ncbi:hypothetical protein GH714_020608 [Hevea brasiliensis]|uniref:Uncharacterized protein n=1 Tax=Hevea brasiliensis TaxID=3981 RepID=A0A6A6KRD7_HEVBR|nr:hypothetical protein GH714_020608 [Hevea brasiliensis]